MPGKRTETFQTLWGTKSATSSPNNTSSSTLRRRRNMAARPQITSTNTFKERPIQIVSCEKREVGSMAFQIHMSALLVLYMRVVCHSGNPYCILPKRGTGNSRREFWEVPECPSVRHLPIISGPDSLSQAKWSPYKGVLNKLHNCNYSLKHQLFYGYISIHSMSV